MKLTRRKITAAGINADDLIFDYLKDEDQVAVRDDYGDITVFDMSKLNEFSSKIMKEMLQEHKIFEQDSVMFARLYDALLDGHVESVGGRSGNEYLELYLKLTVYPNLSNEQIESIASADAIQFDEERFDEELLAEDTYTAMLDDGTFVAVWLDA